MKSIFDFNLTQEQYMKLAKGNPRLPLYVFLPMAILHIAYATTHSSLPLQHVILYIVIGFFIWGFVEYFLHRFPFHYSTQVGLIKFFTSGFHNLHHQVPQSKEYIVAPIYLALWGQLIIELLLYTLTQNISTTLLLGSGVALGYIYYEWIHYLCHHKALKTKYFQRIKESHLQHHFKTPKKNFGVSYPFWDYVFRTHVKPVTTLHQNPTQ